MTPEQEQDVGRCIFREANDAYFLVQPDTLNILEVNPAAQRLTARRRKELLALPLGEVLVSLQGSGLAAVLRACQSTASHSSSDGYALVTASGERRSAHVSASRIHTDPEPLGLVVVRDISLLRQMEEERSRLEARVHQTQKLESLEVLAGGVAHDFNNLLTAMLGYTSLALSEITPGSPAAAMLQEAERIALRAAALTRQMLAYCGQVQLTRQAADLSTLVADTARLVQSLLPPNVRLEYNLSADLPSIAADTGQVTQVLMNLLLNASEALGKEGGTIQLRTGVQELECPHRLDARGSEPLPSGPYVFVEVHDSGCGMDRETQERIFDPFFSTKRAGRGLGLATVRGVMRGHGGTVTVESAPGRGSTFRLYFPAAARPLQLGQPLSEAEPGWQGSGTILVADDETEVRELACHILKRHGFLAEEAKDGREALDLFCRDHGRYRGLLLDVTMPHLSGLEVLAEARRLSPDIPVLLMSGYSVKEAVPDAITGFLPKPFLPSGLLSAVRKLLQPAAPEGAA